jgi:hypothetical protein
MRPSVPSILASLFLYVLCFAQTSIAQEIGFLESFALADDRSTALEELIPGTQEYYFFYALHYQNTEQLDKAAELLEPWLKRHGESNLFMQIRNRQQLLKYSDDPKETLRYLQEKLGLKFDHERQSPDEERELPHKLPDDALTFEKLLPKVQNQHENTQSFTINGLRKLDQSTLTSPRRNDILHRIRQTDFPNLVDLIAADLKHKGSRPFSGFEIHKRLTLKQLDELSTKLPYLKSERPFVLTYLRKLSPPAGTNIKNDKLARRVHIDRLWKFVEPLNPSFNTLKATVLYQALKLDAEEGTFDREQFLRYLRIPKVTPQTNPLIIKDVERDFYVTFSLDLSEQTGFPRIDNDLELVQRYLRHFFIEDTTFEPFTPFLRSEFLEREFATTKILHGLGDPENWASKLTPESYQQLVERVNIEFDSQNKLNFGPKDEVELALNLKNANALLIKVFRINTQNYYRKFKRAVNADINLDGLVPNHEESHQYTDAPALIENRNFKFPQIKKRGVYVVDFIAGGKSSRAIIRKGNLQAVDQVTGAGQLFTVFDQSGSVVSDASLWIAGREYLANAEGQILVPFSTNPGEADLIVSHGELSCFQRFQHRAEAYQLNAGVVVDRESLIRDNQATVLIRPSLTLTDGTLVPVELLKNIRFSIESTDLDGIKNSRTIADLKLQTDSETTCSFSVPPRLHTISFKLLADINNVSKSETQTLTAQVNYSVNSIDKSEHIFDTHLVRSSEGYFIEVLGKTGEVRANQFVKIMFKTEDFAHPFAFSLESDERGLIELGQLENAVSVTVMSGETYKKTWYPHQQNQTFVNNLHIRKGESAMVSAPAGVVEASRDHISLVELRNRTIVADHFDQVQVEMGLIKISGLAAGDYKLRLSFPHRNQSKFFHEISIRVSDGALAEGLIAGNSRILEETSRRPLHFTAIQEKNDEISIQLDNVNEATRIHAIATRYVPVFDALGQFQTAQQREPNLRSARNWQSTFVEGRKIGDEYEYILRRKRQEKTFPGNMLDRPSVLLNPWAIQSTNNQSETTDKGDQFERQPTDSESVRAVEPSTQPPSELEKDFANLDFLGDEDVLILNLTPDENGKVKIDRDKFGDRQHIRFFAINQSECIQRNFNLPLKALAARDGRLAKSIEPSKNFTLAKLTKVMEKGEILAVDGTHSKSFQVYDELSDVFQLFQALNSDTRLNDFAFILDWPSKEDAEKREFYSQFACHELNFFISQKDLEFFNQVVRPHLQNKRDKTFLDRYLLKEDLISFTKPWAYQRLNTVERILLAKRLEERTEDIVRNLNESYLLNPVKLITSDRYYDASIHGLGLDKNAAWYKSDVDGDLPELSLQMNEKFKESSIVGRDAKPGRIAGQQRGETFSAGGAVMSEAIGREPIPEALGKNFRQSINGRFDLPSPTNQPGIDSSRVYFSEPNMVSGGELQMQLQTRTRMVPVTRMRTENRTRTREDGSKETYQVQVPYTEMVTQNYSVQVPRSQGLQLEHKKLEELDRRRKQVTRLYRRISPTQEWVENNYYQLPLATQNQDLVKINRFWRDFANHVRGPFISKHFAETHHSLAEMMFALSVLDLPFEAADSKTDFEELKMKFTAGGPAIALYHQIRETELSRDATTVLVSENIFKNDDRYRFKDGMRYDNFISDQFRSHTLYGAQVVVTNPTSSPRSIEVLYQIPQGSVPCNGSQKTKTIQLDLAAFSTANFEYQFYFPTAGDFDHFPAHVSSREKILAAANAIEFSVSDDPDETDENSWAIVSQTGSDEEVLDFINEKNVLRMDLFKIAFRMKDKAFFEKIIETLRNRYVYNSELWSYSIKHNDPEAVREYLVHETAIADNCGAAFQSPLLTVDAVQKNWYQHKEYSPLINARIHQVGLNRKILNPNLYRQYHQLLNTLAYQNRLVDDDYLVLTYYMLLQDRIDSAIDYFEKVSRNKIAAHIQYDYCDAYLDLYRENPESAAAKAKKWADYPVDLWRKRFLNVLAQVEEIRGGKSTIVDADDQAQQQNQLAQNDQSFELDTSQENITLRYQNLNHGTVNIYLMDVELLFSRTPFQFEEIQGFSLIEPNLSQEIEIDTEKTSQEIPIPESMKNRNVLIEVVSGNQTKSKPLFSNSLNVQMQETLGQLKVTHSESGEAVPKAYIKVYGQATDGTTRFHKDGYTDLRGRFDYVTQSNQSLDNLERLSILILSKDHGTVIKQAQPPKE